EARHSSHVVTAVIRFHARIDRERRPEIDVVIRELLLRRHHPDNRVALRIQIDAAADRLWIATKASLPESMAENHDVPSSLVFFLSGESTAKHRFHANGGQERCCDKNTAQRFGIVAFNKVEPSVTPGGHAFKSCALLLPVEKVARCYREFRE